MSHISKIHALECLDSRGNPTIHATVVLKSGHSGSAMVPSGASTGEHEALELRDADPKRFHGKGVRKAIENIVGPIAGALSGMDVLEMRALDAKMIELDGTPNKGKLGANAILGVSLAAAHAGANYKQQALFEYLGGQSATLMPTPMVNVINGGAHADNPLDFQEFMLVPHLATNFADNIRVSTEIFHTLKKQLVKNKLSTGLGDEGGFAPKLESAEAALDFLMLAIKEAGYIPGKEVSIALDCAASELYNREKGCYVFKKSSGRSFNSSELISTYESWLAKYPIVSIEDGLDENDWSGWTELTLRLGKKVQLVGDDLFVTNVSKLREGFKQNAANAILIKLNQIGTLSETIDAINLASQNGYRSVISHRSGETEDSTIADLAVALNAGQIKTGSVCRGERTAKYNRLLWIESKLGSRAKIKNPFGS